MPRWLIEAEVLSPLVLRRERQSQRSEGADHIAGTQVRGAFARAYLWQRGKVDATFRRLFDEATGVRFGPLDPGEFCFPKTAYSCKRRPGFASDDRSGGKAHGVVDLLPEIIRWSLTGMPPQPARCASCGNDLKPLTGFYRRFGKSFLEVKGHWIRVMRAHVGIDRTTGTAAQAIFYHLPALEPAPGTRDDGQWGRLFGWIDCNEDCRAVLEEILQGEGGILRIGHARTRGYGQVQVRFGDLVQTAPGRWEEWSRTLLKELGLDLDPDHHFLFTINLPTGAILVDSLLRYTLDLADWIPWLPPLPPQPLGPDWRNGAKKAFGSGWLRCVGAVAQHERLRGWNFAQGLPRADEWMVCRGAVYAYLFEGDANDRQLLSLRLRELEQTGVGARLAEGYGQVVVSDDFHVQLGTHGSGNQP